MDDILLFKQIEIRLYAALVILLIARFKQKEKELKDENTMLNIIIKSKCIESAKAQLFAAIKAKHDHVYVIGIGITGTEFSVYSCNTNSLDGAGKSMSESITEVINREYKKAYKKVCKIPPL